MHTFACIRLNAASIIPMQTDALHRLRVDSLVAQVGTHIPRGLISYIPRGLVSYIPRGLISYIPRGLVSYIPRGLVSYIPRGLVSYIPRGLVSYIPRGLVSYICTHKRIPHAQSQRERAVRAGCKAHYTAQDLKIQVWIAYSEP